MTTIGIFLIVLVVPLLDPIAIVGYVAVGLVARSYLVALLLGAGWGVVLEAFVLSMNGQLVGPRAVAVPAVGLICGYAIRFGAASCAVLAAKRIWARRQGGASASTS